MKWDPLRDLLALQDRLGRVEGPDAGWNPPVDVYETQDRYVVTAELPGLPREAIQIELRENELTIRGQRPEPGIPASAYQQMERPQGPFSRTFVFAEPIDGDKVAAELAKGVLTVTVLKGQRPGARRIEVK